MERKSFFRLWTTLGTALGLDWAEVSIWGKLFRIVQYLVQIFIVLGFLSPFLRRKPLQISWEFAMFALGALSLLALSVIAPFFAAAVNMVRMYHITFLFLAPFCVLGGMIFFEWVAMLISTLLRRMNLFKDAIRHQKELNFHKGIRSVPLMLLVLLIIVPYFLFNTGFVFEVTKIEEKFGEIPRSIALSYNRIDGYYRSLQEVTAMSWLNSEIPSDSGIYGDFYSGSLASEYLGPWRFTYISDSRELEQSDWLFWRSYNVETNMLALREWRYIEVVDLEDIPSIRDIITDGQLVYNNGRAQVYVQYD